MRFILDRDMVELDTPGLIERLNAMATSSGLPANLTDRLVDAARSVVENQSQMLDTYEVSIDFVGSEFRLMATPLRMPHNRTRRR